MSEQELKKLSDAELLMRLSAKLSKDAALEELTKRGWSAEDIRETVLRVSRHVPKF